MLQLLTLQLVYFVKCGVLYVILVEFLHLQLLKLSIID